MKNAVKKVGKGIKKAATAVGVKNAGKAVGKGCKSYLECHQEKD